jgi:hypothetical protein
VTARHGGLIAEPNTRHPSQSLARSGADDASRFVGSAAAEAQGAIATSARRERQVDTRYVERRMRLGLESPTGT